MSFDPVPSPGLPTLLGLLFLALLAASEAGRRLGARGPASARGAGLPAAVAFALLVLPLALAATMAVARYDARRAAVLDEADALRIAAHLAPMLPDDDGPAVVNDLRRTLDIALTLGAPSDARTFDADVAETAAVSSRMWGHLGTAVAAEPGSLPASRVAEALTRLDDAVERRHAALRDRVPPAIDAFLFGAAAAAMAFAGHAAGAARARHRAAAVALALLLACAIAETFDLQRPVGGLLEASVAPLEDVRGVLPALP